MSLLIPPLAFFGYPFKPALHRSTVSEAALALASTGEIEALAWEQLAVGGRLIIGEITNAIDRSTIAVFDITDLNENVLFELGYSIGRKKRIWLIRDKSFAGATRRWDKFALLQPIGHARYDNSDEIFALFMRERHNEAETTIFEQLVAPCWRHPCMAMNWPMPAALIGDDDTLAVQRR